jgi:hypothetical protein
MYNKELITAAYLMNAQECDSQVIIIIKRENPAHRRVILAGNSNARFYCCSDEQKSFRKAKFGKYLTLPGRVYHLLGQQERARLHS